MAEQKLLREAGKFINRLDHRWKFLIARGKDHPFKNNVSADDNKGVNSLFFNSEKKVLRLPRQGVYAGRSRYADYPEIVTFVPKKDQGNLLHLFD